MKRTRTDIMNMPIHLCAVDTDDMSIFDTIFEFLKEVDARFSTYKEESETLRLNHGEIMRENLSEDFLEVLRIADDARKRTNGYFSIERADTTIDPSGVVKGWAIKRAAEMLALSGSKNFMVDIAGDIASEGVNEEGATWAFGIKNPFNKEEIIKVVYPHGKGIATSGSYERGAHIYNPHDASDRLETIVSTTVIARDVLEADLLATAAHAMSENGIVFLESLPDVEGYVINASGEAIMTSGFSVYTLP